MAPARYLSILGFLLLIYADFEKGFWMRTFEIIAALVLAAIAFVVVKILGLFLKFALIAAVLGFVAGLLLARLFRR